MQSEKKRKKKKKRSTTPVARVMSPDGKFYTSKLAVMLQVCAALDAAGKENESMKYMLEASPPGLGADAAISMARKYVDFIRSRVM